MKKIQPKRPHTKLLEPVEVIEEPIVEEAPALKVTPLTIELGREDLNQLLSKLNEVIEVINNS